MSRAENTSQVAASLLAQCSPSGHTIGFHPELFFAARPNEAEVDEVEEVQAATDQAASLPGAFTGVGASVHGFGPGPSSPEDAAAQLAQCCTILRDDVLASLQLRDEVVDAETLRAALCQWGLPDQTTGPPASPGPNTTGAPEPALASCTPKLAGNHGTGSTSPNPAPTSCPAAADSSGPGPALASWPPEPETVPGRTSATPEPAPASRPPKPGAARSSGSASPLPRSCFQSALPLQIHHIGLNLGGLILWQGPGPLMVPGAEAGVGHLVRALGPERVSIISRVNSELEAGGRIAQLTLSGFFRNTGLDSSRVHWTNQYYGPGSKGPCPSQPKIFTHLSAAQSARHTLQAQQVARRAQALWPGGCVSLTSWTSP